MAPSRQQRTKVKGSSGIAKKIIIFVIVIAVIAGGVYAVPKVFSGIGNITDKIPFIGNDSESDFSYYEESFVEKAVDVPFSELQGDYAGVAQYTTVENLEILADNIEEEDVEYLNVRLGKEMTCVMEAGSSYIDIYTSLEGETEDYEETLFDDSYENGIFETLETDSIDGIEMTYTAKAVVLDGNNDYRIVGYFEIQFENAEGEIGKVIVEYDAERDQP